MPMCPWGLPLVTHVVAPAPCHIPTERETERQRERDVSMHGDARGHPLKFLAYSTHKSPSVLASWRPLINFGPKDQGIVIFTDKNVASRSTSRKSPGVLASLVDGSRKVLASQQDWSEIQRKACREDGRRPFEAQRERDKDTQIFVFITHFDEDIADFPYQIDGFQQHSTDRQANRDKDVESGHWQVVCFRIIFFDLFTDT